MKTILVLEDDCDVLGLLGYVLKQYDIIEAASDTQAIRLFNRHGHHIDLLLADVKLPRSSGIRVALHIRSELPSVPVILTSGYSIHDLSDQNSADLKMLGVNSVTLLQRPLEMELLSKTVRALIGSSEMARTA
jgi:DNA-binding response OmpR family regulator